MSETVLAYWPREGKVCSFLRSEIILVKDYKNIYTFLNALLLPVIVR